MMFDNKNSAAPGCSYLPRDGLAEKRTLDMNGYTMDRAWFAANALVYLAIALGTLAFWSEALSGGNILDVDALLKDPGMLIGYVVAGVLTIAMVSASYLLSITVPRIADAMEKKAYVTVAMVGLLGAVLVLIEGGMTHQGLAWLDARQDIAPEWALWVASFGLSAFNVFSLYAFVRQIKKPIPELTMAGRLLQMNRKDRKAA